jgi:hypothetical protein
MNLFAGSLVHYLRLVFRSWIKQKDRHEKECKYDDPRTFLEKFRKNEQDYFTAIF